MDQYITTYQKDYVWPSRKIQRAASKLDDADSCSCDSSHSREIKVTELCGDQQSWSRMGPMGRLLDPKLYPAKTGPHPETDVTKFDQPSTYIKKLEEKHPNLYGVLKETSEDEIRFRVDQDRLKTTYQVDYGAKEMETCSSDQTNGKLTSPDAPKEDDASPRAKLIQQRSGKQDDKQKSTQAKKGEEEGQETRLPPWRSEYQDSISKLGSSIMTLKMHQKKTVAPGWPSKLTNRQKSASHTTTPTGNQWHRDARAKSTSFTGSRIYQQACGSEHEIKYLGARTSEESIGGLEYTYANKNNNGPNESVFVNIAPRPDNIAIKYPRFAEYNDNYRPEAFLAMQKLRKLKELQVKRDMSEKYYSEEIKKLIGDYYFEAKALASSAGPRGKLQSSSFQTYTANRLKNSLEPCGTMTTITRLNCGCIQETTRPIFTTSRGRVQRRNCSQSQNEVFLKSTPSNPQEHLFATIDSRDDRQRVNARKRPDVEPRAYIKIPQGGDRTCENETESEIRNEPEEPNMTERVSKSASPYCKFSDTSVAST